MVYQDDYINASYLRQISPNSPDFVITQLPMKGHLVDLLSMVWQEGIETILSMVPMPEMGEGTYVPLNKEPLHIGDYSISLKSFKVRMNWIESRFNSSLEVTWLIFRRWVDTVNGY